MLNSLSPVDQPRQDQEGRLHALRPQPAGDFVAVDVRQHDVEQDQVEFLVPRHLQGGLAKLGPDAFLDRPAQHFPNRRRRRRVVLHMKYSHCRVSQPDRPALLSAKYWPD